jgi:histidinol-phosphate phosphatase family protein
MKKRALFLDRDGVINVPPPPEIRYILEPRAFYLMPGIAEAVRLCNEHSIPVVVVTNQKCIAAGQLTPETLENIHARMRELLAEQNAKIDGLYFCPHREEDHCQCRKPRPGMILQAAADLKLDLKHSWLAGDQPRDIEAGRAAGCHTLHIGTPSDPSADVQLTGTEELPEWINHVFLQKEDCHA